MATRIKLLSGVVLAVVTLWSGAWLYGRSTVLGEIDARIAQLAEAGTIITCPDRTASGWPFRLEVTCALPSVALADGSRLSAARIAATWHVTDPMLILLDLAAPVQAVLPDGTDAEAGFDRLRASLRLNTTGVERLSAETSKLAVTLTGPALVTASADVAEVHLRPAGPDAADVAMTLRQADSRIDGVAPLPAPVDVAVDGTATGLSALEAGPQSWAQAGGMVEMRTVRLAIGDSVISASGTAGLEPAGTLVASIEAQARGLDWLTAQASAGKPVPPALSALASSFLLLGKPMEDGARQLSVEASGGAFRANGLSIGQTPPLF